MTTKRHYHVYVNMAGYMPEGDPEVYTDRRSAEQAAMWHKEQFLELGDTNEKGDWVPEYRVAGSAKTGGYVVSRTGDSRYSLDTYIHLDGPCTDASCAEWFDEEGNVVEM